jgi:MFS family permease
MAKSAGKITHFSDAKPKGAIGAVTSAWSPLQEPVFRSLWLATVASNLGTWMQDVGASWLMLSLTTSPILVALVETAGSLPIVLLALPAGALADVVGKRRLVLVTQTWMLVSAAALGVLTIAGLTTPWLLLLLTFTLGLGSAMNSPAWQAIIPELVPRRELSAAVTLSSVAINVSRAVGPALGGLIVAAAGSGVVFLLNAVSFLAVIVVIYRWQPAPTQSTRPAEHVLGAMRAGVRYVRYSPELRATFVRTASFIICASALWALLPLQARHGLGLGSFGYGVLLGCIGAGAVSGAGLLPTVRRKISNNLLVIGASLLFAIVTVVLAFVSNPVLVGLSLIFGGFAWIAVVSSFNTAAQAAAPAWVRARALSLYTLVFMGGMAIGSAIWGAVAAQFGVKGALVFSATGLIAGSATSLRYRLTSDEGLSLAPWDHWPEPVVVVEPKPEQGPILVQIEYRIDPTRAGEFREAMRDMRRIRRRDGSIHWGLFHDAAEPDRFVESFVNESWAEHLRQHSRITEADKEIENRIFSFHIGGGRPPTIHLIAEHVPR